MSNQTNDWIDRYLRGELSDQQKARLETWYLLKAEEEQETLIHIDDEKTGAKMWSAMMMQMDTDTTARPKVLRRSLQMMFKVGIAAMLILVAGITYLMLGRKTGNEDHFVVRPDQDIAPGSNQARLTLADGRIIDLTDANVGQLTQEKGLEITKTQDGMLVYKVSETQKAQAGLNMISTPAGGQYTVILSDGTKVWLNASSALRYPAKFAANSRQVSLSGEAYFEVAHIATKKGRQPFVVTVLKGETESEKVNVLGTHFNINAYADEPAVNTTLLEGSVRIDHKGQQNLLTPGQQAKLENGKITVQKADTEMAVSWTKGDFVFREDLESAMRKVARWYDVEVIYDQSAPKDLKLGGWLSRASNISEVLNHIQLTGKVHFKLEGRRVTVFR